MKPNLLLVSAILFLATPLAHAEPTFARMYKAEYGYGPSCNACHKDGGGTPLNEYGQAFKDAGMKQSGFAAIATIDSDGDGDTNETEIRAKANPGFSSSTASEPGDWLDTANLIPREVQAVFPGITRYKPVDAILTDKEINAARGIGLELTARDENTIYLPLNESNRPVGIALIQSAEFEGKQFFLLVATDGKLNLRNVVPINTKHVPAAEKSAVYAKLEGRPAKNLKTPARVASVDDAIVLAVKKATTIIRLRLSGK